MNLTKHIFNIAHHMAAINHASKSYIISSADFQHVIKLLICWGHA